MCCMPKNRAQSDSLARGQCTWPRARLSLRRRSGDAAPPAPSGQAALNPSRDGGQLGLSWWQGGGRGGGGEKGEGGGGRAELAIRHGAGSAPPAQSPWVGRPGRATGVKIKQANVARPQKHSLVPGRGEDTALRLACFSSPQERVRPDPAGLKLPFNQLCFPELLHPVNPPAITITAIKGGISC